MMKMNDSGRLKKLYQIEERRFAERVRRYEDIGYMMDTHQFCLEDILLRKERTFYKYIPHTQGPVELSEEDSLGFDYEFIHKSVGEVGWRSEAAPVPAKQCEAGVAEEPPSKEQKTLQISKPQRTKGARVYACEIEGCSKRYTSSFGLKYHMKEGHSEEKMNIFKPFICPFDGCDKKYKNNNGLKYHIKHYHDDRMP